MSPTIASAVRACARSAPAPVLAAASLPPAAAAVLARRRRRVARVAARELGPSCLGAGGDCWFTPRPRVVVVRASEAAAAAAAAAAATADSSSPGLVGSFRLSFLWLDRTLGVAGESSGIPRSEGAPATPKVAAAAPLPPPPLRRCARPPRPLPTAPRPVRAPPRSGPGPSQRGPHSPHSLPLLARRRRVGGPASRAGVGRPRLGASPGEGAAPQPGRGGHRRLAVGPDLDGGDGRGGGPRGGGRGARGRAGRGLGLAVGAGRRRRPRIARGGRGPLPRLHVCGDPLLAPWARAARGGVARGGAGSRGGRAGAGFGGRRGRGKGGERRPGARRGRRARGAGAGGLSEHEGERKSEARKGRPRAPPPRRVSVGSVVRPSVAPAPAPLSHRLTRPAASPPPPSSPPPPGSPRRRHRRHLLLPPAPRRVVSAVESGPEPAPPPPAPPCPAPSTG